MTQCHFVLTQLHRSTHLLTCFFRHRHRDWGDFNLLVFLQDSSEGPGTHSYIPVLIAGYPSGIAPATAWEHHPFLLLTCFYCLCRKRSQWVQSCPHALLHQWVTWWLIWRRIVNDHQPNNVLHQSSICNFERPTFIPANRDSHKVLYQWYNYRHHWRNLTSLILNVQSKGKKQSVELLWTEDG